MKWTEMVVVLALIALVGYLGNGVISCSKLEVLDDTEYTNIPVTITATANMTALQDTGYIDTSEIKEDTWEQKYDDLWQAYKHAIWHYDAQAENLLQERNNLLEQLEKYRPSDNFTIIWIAHSLTSR